MAIISIPLLKVLLLAIMFLAVFVEIKTGGMGAGILLGLVAACVFWGSEYMQGTAALYEIAIFLAGILCIVVEMLTPAVGLLAGLGVAMMLYSIVLVLGGDIQAVYALLIALAVSVAAFALLVKKLPASRLWNRLVLKEQSRTSSGYVSAPSRDGLLGKTGEVLSELRPAGSAQIEGTPVDVVSEGVFIAKGQRVRLVAVEGSRVVVRKI